MSTIDLNLIEAARLLASMSPETQKRFDDCVALGWSDAELETQAFHAIGVAIGSTRKPVSDASKKRLFATIEQLLTQGHRDVANAVATCLLEQVWTAAQTGGFDFDAVDRYLGAEARGYLLALDEFHGTKTDGLRRK